MALRLCFRWLVLEERQASYDRLTVQKVKSHQVVHIERIIGLKMLNEIDNHDYDSLPVLFFNLPEAVPLRKYSFRANASMAPDDYVKGLIAVNKPMLVLIGSEDEVFSEEALRRAVLDNSIGEMQIIGGASHNGVRHNAQSFTFIKGWFIKL